MEFPLQSGPHLEGPWSASPFADGPILPRVMSPLKEAWRGPGHAACSHVMQLEGLLRNGVKEAAKDTFVLNGEMVYFN